MLARFQILTGVCAACRKGFDGSTQRKIDPVPPQKNIYQHISKEFKERLMITAKNRNLAFASIIIIALSATTYAQTAALGAAAPVPAGGPVPTRIGVINMQAAIFASNEGRRDFDALSKKFEPKQAELKTQSDEIETLKKQLTAQQDKLNEEERANRVRSIEQKQKSFQRVLEDTQTDFQAQYAELGNRIGAKMSDVMVKYATTNNLAVIVDVSGQQSQVLWASDQVNITPSIVTAYNAASGVPAPPPSAPSPSATRPTAQRPGTSPAKKPAPPK